MENTRAPFYSISIERTIWCAGNEQLGQIGIRQPGGNCRRTITPASEVLSVPEGSAASVQDIFRPYPGGYAPTAPSRRIHRHRSIRQLGSMHQTAVVTNKPDGQGRKPTTISGDLFVGEWSFSLLERTAPNAACAGAWSSKRKGIHTLNSPGRLFYVSAEGSDA